jgi:hypothetical protein
MTQDEPKHVTIIDERLLLYNKCICVDHFNYYRIMKDLTLINYDNAHIIAHFNHRIVILCFFKGSF